MWRHRIENEFEREEERITTKNSYINPDKTFHHSMIKKLAIKHLFKLSRY